MPATANTFSPQPYASKSTPGLHSGRVSCLGNVTVDLGIGHSNFVPTVVQEASTAAAVNNAHKLSWAYGTKPGTFIIYAWKVTTLASNPTLIAATVAINVSFTAVAASSVG